jgi:galactokinase
VTKKTWLAAVNSPAWNSRIQAIYGDSSGIDKRMHYLMECFDNDADVRIFSTPGRTELAGNHTDHNRGRVLAGSVHLDALAAVTPRSDNKVILESAGYRKSFKLDLSDLEPIPQEAGSFASLIRGVTAGFSSRGYTFGGFKGRIHSRIPAGSGLSSSAAIEVLLGTILSGLYNENAVPAVEIAKIGKYAENRYFNKPCGLMDQTACAVGGISSIDFSDPDNPRVDKMDFSFNDHNYILCVVDTGGSHADLTEDYAACPREMFSVAGALSRESASEIETEELLSAIPSLRSSCGDRAILRTLHFITENQRVIEMARAIRKGDISSYISIMNASGDSSWKLLQNCYSCGNPSEQGIPLAVELARLAVGNNAAFRVHGGGFAGTIQALVSKKDFMPFSNRMERVFGKGSVIPIRVRSQGSIELVL